MVGASIAQRLARAGQRVVLVDQAADVGGGCSHANAAILAPDHVAPLATPAMLRETPGHMLRRPPTVRVHPDPRLVPWLASLAGSATPGRVHRAQGRLRGLAERSTQLHRQLHADGLSPGLTKTGAVDAHLEEPSRHPSGWLPVMELRQIEPAIRGPVAGGQHHAEEWTLESRQFTRAMLDDAAAHGAEINFSCDVRELLVDGGRVRGARISTSTNSPSTSTILADAVVLAAGLGVRSLAAQAGVHVPLRGGRGYVIDVAPSAGDPVMPVRLKDRRIVVTPLADRVRVSGAMEFGKEGRPARKHHAARLRAVAADIVPSLADSTVIQEWVGERPCVPDGVPVIGGSDRVGGLHLAAGHGMWGMILAPVTAELVADSLAAGSHGWRVSAEQDWLHPDRFTRQGASPARQEQLRPTS